MSTHSPHTASSGLAAVRRGELSVEAWARQCLSRIAERDPQIHAWTWVDPQAVLNQARELDKWETQGPLHGVPIGFKDIIHTADMPTQFNSPIYRGFQGGIDAGCVAVLRAAGALILGKTETVEFASNARKALTRNPHDLARTPGGSSSGSAAAVADAQVPIALGTQTGGSVIRPAAFCGTWGFKPTWGTVTRDGSKTYAPTLDTIGWYGRSVDDLSLVFSVFDTLLDDRPRVTGVPPVAGASIGLCRTPIWPSASTELQALMEQTHRALVGQGARVSWQELPSGCEDLARAHYIIMRAEGRVNFLPEMRQHAHQLHPFIQDHYTQEAEVTPEQLHWAYDLAARCRPAVDAMASEFDYLVAPSSAGYAPLGLHTTGDPAFNSIWTLLHVPCLNVPVQLEGAKLPLGLTLITRRGNDPALFEHARRWVEAGLAREFTPPDLASRRS